MIKGVLFINYMEKHGTNGGEKSCLIARTKQEIKKVDGNPALVAIRKVDRCQIQPGAC